MPILDTQIKMTRGTTLDEFMEVMQKLFKDFMDSKGYSKKDIQRLLAEYRMKKISTRKRMIDEREAELKALKEEGW